MAVTEQPGPATDPRACGSAPEFVRDRLGEAESPMSPAELSDEYDCAGGYMRDVLSDLAAEGVVERVATGRYVLADGDADDSDDETDGSVPTISDDGTADIPTELDDADGDDDMPTQEEYRQQHSESDDGSADGSASSEPAGSDGNASASSGSDGPDDSGGETALAATAGVGGGALSLLDDNGPSARQIGVVVALAVGLYLLWRVSQSDGSEPEPDAGGEQADDDTAATEGGLVNEQ